MNHIDFNQPMHVYFIGIGGISMSGLAEILLSKNFKVSGSDMKASPLTDHLSAQGICIHIGHHTSNITKDIDLVVYTAAIHQDNPELLATKDLHILSIPRAELLGEVMRNYKVSIGVSGTHGKTTTTSMLSEILLSGDLDPTISVGGILPSIGGNLRIGQSSTFITEACEYTNSFLSLYPNIEIILNIEEDHMDFFKDINDIRTSFHNYIQLLPADGLLVINQDIDHVEDLYRDCPCKVITVGHNPDSNYSASNISYNEEAQCIYTLIHNGIEISTIQLGVPGLHNVYNSLATIAVAEYLNLPISTIADSLAHFRGTNRRFQKKGTFNGITIIDDYAHHPSEIRATINSAKNYPHKRIIIVFQPHTYTRTLAFLSDFSKELSKADLVILTDIYAARETNTTGISSCDIKKEIDRLGGACIYLQDFKLIQDYIIENGTDGDLVITMGAGNIVEVGENLLANL